VGISVEEECIVRIKKEEFVVYEWTKIQTSYGLITVEPLIILLVSNSVKTVSREIFFDTAL
jgi:hypothetical protein